MKITKVEAFLMSYPMPQVVRLPFHGGERTILKRDAMLIRVTTDTGLKGYAPGPAHERASQEIRAVIAPFLDGKDPRQWDKLDFPAWLTSRAGSVPANKMRSVSGHEPISLTPSLSPSEGERVPEGRVRGAASLPERAWQSSPADLIKTYRAVEIALMDVTARYEGCPLSELIGGRKRERIKLYGSAGMYMAPEQFATEAAAVQAMGFPAYKMRPALGPDEDLRTARLMREATGGDFGLMIDAHSWWRMGDSSYSPETVARLAQELAAFHPTWLEEPLPPDDHNAYRKLKTTSPIAIATGEHEQEESGFMDLIATRAADYLQMDVCCQGGFEMGRRVFDAVGRAGLRFAFHSWGTTLEVLAAAHLGVCWPESVVEWLEYPCYANEGRAGMYPFPLSDEILKEPMPIKDGHLHVPATPGLGIEVDERVIERYPFIPGPWSFFRLDSPAETVAVTGDHSVKWVEGKVP